jgi:hypothetical protein
MYLLMLFDSPIVFISANEKYDVVEVFNPFFSKQKKADARDRCRHQILYKSLY